MYQRQTTAGGNMNCACTKTLHISEAAMCTFASRFNARNDI